MPAIQAGATDRDYAEYFVGDPDVKGESPAIRRGPARIHASLEPCGYHRRHAAGKTLVFVQVGRSTAGQAMIRSHTRGARFRPAISEIMAAFPAPLRHHFQADSYDEFVETIALFASAPLEFARGWQ